MNARAEAVEALQGRLGHAFSDKKLLERALTHKSSGHGAKKIDDNQRLEFMGDRVLGLLTSEWLVGRFPDADEGELTHRLHALSNGAACARVAGRIGVGAALRMAAAETQRGARLQEAFLNDACEALLAALYLDAGLARTREIWLDIWKEELESPTELKVENIKATLQEWVLAQGKPLPRYVVLKREGLEHEPTFTVSVTVEGLEPSIAVGSSRKEAEKTAARELLTREGVL